MSIGPRRTEYRPWRRWKEGRLDESRKHPPTLLKPGKEAMEDQVEKIIYEGLDKRRIEYSRNKVTGGREIDFYLPEFDLWIEVCQFYTPRKIKQLENIPNIILIQGRHAASLFISLIKC